MAWTIQYDANDLPDSSVPVWTKNGDATTIEISPTGFLHVVTSAATLEYTREPGSVSNATGITAEMRVKVVSDGTNGISYLLFDDGTLSATVVFNEASVAIEGFEGSLFYNLDMTDDYHTIRATIKGTVLNVYIDGTLRITDAAWAVGGGSNQISWGHIDSANQEILTDYLYFTSEGAFSSGDGEVSHRYYDDD